MKDFGFRMDSMELSSSLQADFDVGNLYVNTNPYNHPTIRNKTVEDLLLKSSQSDEVTTPQ